ncbi:MAG: SurA N-terminal domain-containing protein [Betaproteobacteria bacterium]|nr:MAG: SurA N-terminal domain-containing protein [Betaproteobacteria bacterium]
MFDFVTKNRILVYIVIALIALTFAFFGVDAYFRGGGGAADEVATVGDSKITVQEFGMSVRRAQDRMRAQAQGQQNQQMNAYLNSPEFRQAVLDEMIERRVLLQQAARAGMAVSTEELRSVIASIEAFYDEDGKFSIQRYEQLLRAQNMTPAQFERQIEQDILLGRIRNTVAGTAFMPNKVVERLVRIREQEREVSQLVVSPVEFRDKVEVTEEEAKEYFEENKSLFRIPERAKLEYLVLTPEVAAANVEVSDDELKQIYEQRITEFQTAEERRASHILITVSSDASDEDKAAAEAKASDIYQQLQAEPNRFAELARANSGDPGSAEQGGDLGFFQRGFMVKEFEDAAFALEKGEISAPVKTQFGYHIIRIDEIKAVETTPFAQVREQLLKEVRESRVQEAYLEAAQTFSDLVYTEYDSLKPTADTLNLTIQQSDWVSPTSGGMNPLLNNTQLLEAVFSAESLEERRNTDAVEVQPNTMVSARVVEHAPPSDMPFEEVSGDIVDFLKSERAIEQAKTEGDAIVEKLISGEEVKGLDWSRPSFVTLQRREGLHPEGARAVFSADAAKLPAFVGVAIDDGRYVVYRITEVREVESVSPDQLQTASRQLSQITVQEQYANIVGSMRERSEVRVREDRVQPDQAAF